MFNVNKIRKDFPILSRKINGYPLVYLDNGASSQKPKQVLAAIDDYYLNHNANIKRGVHILAEEATNLYEGARKTVSSFIGASDPREVIFVRNSTEAINLVAFTWGRKNIDAGDEIITTEMEHHSNLVPWQVLAEEKKAKLKFIPFDNDGFLDLSFLENNISAKTKLLTLVHISNSLGTINDVNKICEIAKRKNPNILILIDGSQSAPHSPIDLKKIGCDFFAFTGHKMLGPMGIGVLWGRKEILNQMPPFLYGGEMIKEVYLDHATWNEIPEKFEAGTPNVGGSVGLAAAISYLNKLGMDNVRKHELMLTKYALLRLSTIPEIKIIGPKEAESRGGIIAFSFKGVHSHDVAEVLNKYAICVRSGHHCAMPVHEKLNLPATTRISFSIYNTKEEIDILIKALGEVRKIFKV